MADADVLSAAVESASDVQRAILLIIRFVVLELTLKLWDFVPTAVSSVVIAGVSAVVYLNTAGDDRFATVAASAALAPAAVQFLFSIFYWIIVFGFGWPLLKDTCSYLGIPIRSLLDLLFIGRRRGPSNV